MMGRIRFAAAAAALALAVGAAPRAAQAQTSMSVVCALGVGCSQLRFDLASVGGLSLNSLTLNLLPGSTSWRFAPLGGPGVYGAEDAFGVFGGFTTIDAAGTGLSIDFLDNGFPFELGAGGTGYVQVEGINDTPDGLIVDYVGTTVTGSQVTGRAQFGPGGPAVVPEPMTVVLTATGLVAVAGIARRRTR